MNCPEMTVVKPFQGNFFLDFSKSVRKPTKDVRILKRTFPKKSGHTYVGGIDIFINVEVAY